MMLKKHMAACLVASAFITMPVLAQTSTSPGATSPGASQPATGATGGGASTSGSSAGGSGRFITEQQTNQWRASRLIGIDVYGADNQKIGDINEVLVDRQGNADAVVVGVGGFLGIGEKNVALPFSAFEWQMDDSRRTASAGSSASGTGSGAGNTASSARTSTDTAAAPVGTAAGSPSTASTSGTTATTGAGTGAAVSPASRGDTTASTSAAGGRSRSSSSAQRGYPDHAVLRMSKADLENAPTFRYVGDRSDSNAGASRSGGSGSTGTSGSGTAPRQ